MTDSQDNRQADRAATGRAAAGRAADPDRPAGGTDEKNRTRAAAERLEAAVAELVAVAGEEAARHVERAVVGLRDKVEQRPAAAAAPLAAAAPFAADRERRPLWLWSNKPRARRLYRTSRPERRLLGVCGGLANLYGLEPFITRLALIALVLWTSGAALVAYVVAAIIMDREPPEEAAARRAGRQLRGNPPATAERADANTASAASGAPVDLAETRVRFAELERRLRRLEGFVTADHFDLRRQFAKIGNA